MSEQMSAGELLNRLRGSVTRTTIHPYLTQSEAAALILADRKATVERCKKAAYNYWDSRNNAEYIDIDGLKSAIDAVLEEP